VIHASVIKYGICFITTGRARPLKMEDLNLIYVRAAAFDFAF